MSRFSSQLLSSFGKAMAKQAIWIFGLVYKNNKKNCTLVEQISVVRSYESFCIFKITHSKRFSLTLSYLYTKKCMIKLSKQFDFSFEKVFRSHRPVKKTPVTSHSWEDESYLLDERLLWRETGPVGEEERCSWLSCFRHLARRFWNHTWDRSQLDQCGELEVATVSSPPDLHID